MSLRFGLVAAVGGALRALCGCHEPKPVAPDAKAKPAVDLPTYEISKSGAVIDEGRREFRPLDLVGLSRRQKYKFTYIGADKIKDRVVFLNGKYTLGDKTTDFKAAVPIIGGVGEADCGQYLQVAAKKIAETIPVCTYTAVGDIPLVAAKSVMKEPLATPQPKPAASPRAGR